MTTFNSHENCDSNYASKTSHQPDKRPASQNKLDIAPPPFLPKNSSPVISLVDLQNPPDANNNSIGNILLDTSNQQAHQDYDIALGTSEKDHFEGQQNTEESSNICGVAFQSSQSNSHKETSTSSTSAALPPPPPYSPPVSSVFSMSMQQSQHGAPPIITQVSMDAQPGLLDQGLGVGNNIKLDLRGTLIELTRSELSQLPESLLLGISNGLCTDNMGNIMFSAAEVAVVNFSPECLQFTLDVFRKASEEILPSASEPATPSSPTESSSGDPGISELLRTRPAIIVLREDLDYYCLPPSPDISSERMTAIKRECGKRLVEHNHIFSALQRGENPGSAEQHLMDMLCSSGFSIDERWGFRSLEPNKTVVSSLALVRLRPMGEGNLQGDTSDRSAESHENTSVFTGVSPCSTKATASSGSDANIDGEPADTCEHSLNDAATVENHSIGDTKTKVEDEVDPSHVISQVSTENKTTTDSLALAEEPAGSSAEESVPQPETDMSKSHKLLLFWRKPARKCWWDSVVLNDIPNVPGPVKVHIRSVWTLELSVMSNSNDFE